MARSPASRAASGQQPAQISRSEGSLWIDYSLEADDHVAFARFVQWDAPERRGYRLVVQALPLAMILLPILSLPDSERLGTQELVFMGFCVLAALLTPRWMRYRIGWRVRRHLSANRGRGLTGPMRLELGRKVFAIEGPNGRSERPKGARLQLRETPTHLFFFVQEKAAYLLPLAAFSAEEIGQIREAAEHLESAGRL
jgi:hypothetical protein